MFPRMSISSFSGSWWQGARLVALAALGGFSVFRHQRTILLGVEALGGGTFRHSGARVRDFGALSCWVWDLLAFRHQGTRHLGLETQGYRIFEGVERQGTRLLGLAALGYETFRPLGARVRDFWTLRHQGTGLCSL